MASTDSNGLTPAQMGAILQAAAYAEPPLKPANLALVVIVISLVTIIIATIVIALRIGARAWIGRNARTWGWDDTFAILGYVAFTCSGIFAVKAAYYGLGSPDSKLNEFLMVRCAEVLLYSQVLYGVSMPLIKASVVFTLVRITTDKWLRWALYFMQFLATFMAIVGILASLLYCHPVRAYWNPLLGSCGDFMVVVKIGYAWTAIGIVSDLMCAILPFFIVRKLQMPRRTKITVMVILGLGAVASCATIVRAPYLQYYLVSTDRFYWNGHITIWCLLESGISLVACSLPALRLLFRSYFDGSQNDSGARSKTFPSEVNRNLDCPDTSTPMDTLSPVGRTTVISGTWKRLDDDQSSARHIIQERTVSIRTGSTDDYENMA